MLGFIFYILFFCWLITKISFFKHSGINRWWLIGLFVLKIAAGFAFAWFYALPAYAKDADTYRYFRLSLGETQWLWHDPFAFIKDLFTYGYTKSGGLFAGENSYWNDLKDNVIVKLLAVCNVFTNSNYYTDIVFFNFVFLFGPVAFFRVMKSVTKASDLQLILPIFLLPSFLFWCSGIHKDGLIFSSIALIIYFFYQQIQQRKIIASSFVLLLLCFLFLFAIRNFVALLLLPALLAWLLSEKFPSKKWLIFSSIYLIGVAVFILSFHIPSFNIAHYVIAKQQDFTVLSAGSKVAVPVLQPTAASFIHYFPYAIDLIFLRPYPSDVKNFGYIPPLIENILIAAMIITAVFYAIKRKISFPSVFIFCIFFSLSILIVEGYTVPFVGALVRYKADVITLLITPLFLLIPLLRFKANKH